MMTNDNDINLFYWDNRLSVDGVMNVGYDDEVRLMDLLCALMKID